MAENPSRQAPSIARIAEALCDYRGRFPDEASSATRFLDFAGSGPDVCSRLRRDGHFTASCWLVSADGQRVLLTHHRKLGRWLQLGGHVDHGETLADAALREAGEESGLSSLTIDPLIFDLDDHRIPARGEEPEHTHWDVRYVLRCAGAEDFRLSPESHALAWVEIERLASAADADLSVRRMAQKWMRRCR